MFIWNKSRLDFLLGLICGICWIAVFLFYSSSSISICFVKIIHIFSSHFFPKEEYSAENWTVLIAHSELELSELDQWRAVL